MWCKYDVEVDILTLKLSKKKPDFGEQSGNLITHYDKSGKLIEIEMLDARITMKKIAKLIGK